MMKYFLRIWRTLPLWMHILGAKLVRPKFRVAVAALVFNEHGAVLLFKHTYRKFEWGIPAGGLEHQEQPADAIAREFLEETGMQIHVERLLTAISAREDHNISLIYLCKLLGGEFKQSHEISEIRFFAADDLPIMLFAEKELIRQVITALKPDK